LQLAESVHAAKVAQLEIVIDLSEQTERNTKLVMLIRGDVLVVVRRSGRKFASVARLKKKNRKGI
jgi:hypothetical protein